MEYALTAVIFALIALLVYEIRASRAERNSILYRLEAERQILLNRIQAPETAVAQTIQPTAGKKHVSFNDDDEYMRVTSGDS